MKKVLFLFLIPCMLFAQKPLKNCYCYSYDSEYSYRGEKHLLVTNVERAGYFWNGSCNQRDNFRMQASSAIVEVYGHNNWVAQTYCFDNAGEAQDSRSTLVRIKGSGSPMLSLRFNFYPNRQELAIVERQYEGYARQLQSKEQDSDDIYSNTNSQPLQMNSQASNADASYLLITTDRDVFISLNFDDKIKITKIQGGKKIPVNKGDNVVKVIPVNGGVDPYSKSIKISSSGNTLFNIELNKIEQAKLENLSNFEKGEALYEGKGVMKSYNDALIYYKKSADEGNILAINKVGNMYENGVGVSQDYHTAIKYYEIAVKKGSSFALYSLGNMYIKGKGVVKNNNTGISYLKRAANRGNIEAMLFLGDWYELDNEARFYYLMAVKKGSIKAMFRLGRYYYDIEDIEQ